MNMETMMVIGGQMIVVIIWAMIRFCVIGKLCFSNSKINKFGIAFIIVTVIWSIVSTLFMDYVMGDIISRCIYIV